MLLKTLQFDGEKILNVPFFPFFFRVVELPSSDEEDIDKVVEKEEPKKPTSKGKYFLK